MRYIYTITSVSKHEEVPSRLWGVFTNKKQARLGAKNNTEFYSECKYYKYIVVEKYKTNVVSQIPKEIFWYDLDNKKEIKKPKQFNKITNFAFG